MALGATPSTIGKMIVSRGAGLAGIGVVVGLIAARGQGEPDRRLTRELKQLGFGLCILARSRRF